MINAARSLGGKTRSDDAVKFEVSPAEECSTVAGLAPESVDLLTSAMAVSSLFYAVCIPVDGY